MFDRMIFKGHLSALYKQDGARCLTEGRGLVDAPGRGLVGANTENPH
jgi:hypothetical protein